MIKTFYCNGSCLQVLPLGLCLKMGIFVFGSGVVPI